VEKLVRLKPILCGAMSRRLVSSEVICTLAFKLLKASINAVSEASHNSNKKLNIKDQYLKIVRHCFHVVNMWNSLPEEVVAAGSFNCFKGSFDRWNIGIKFKL